MRYLNSASAAVAELIAGYDSDDAVEAGGAYRPWMPRGLSPALVQAVHMERDSRASLSCIL